LANDCVWFLVDFHGDFRRIRASVSSRHDDGYELLDS
jgi:hypothetical protein